MEKLIIVDPNESLSRRYAVRKSHGKGRTLETCIPVEAVEREAKRCSLSLDEFIGKYDAEFLYNNFGGIHIRFVERTAH